MKLKMHKQKAKNTGNEYWSVYRHKLRFFIFNKLDGDGFNLAVRRCVEKGVYEDVDGYALESFNPATGDTVVRAITEEDRLESLKDEIDFLRKQVKEDTIRHNLLVEEYKKLTGKEATKPESKPKSKPKLRLVKGTGG